jgi:hypothetical protein
MSQPKAFRVIYRRTIPMFVGIDQFPYQEIVEAESLEAVVQLINDTQDVDLIEVEALAGEL